MRRRELVVMLVAGMAAWPLVAPAEQSASPVIGFLHAASPSPIKDRLDAFRAGLKEGGYTEGQNVAIEYRWAEGGYDRLPYLRGNWLPDRLAFWFQEQQLRQSRQKQPAQFQWYSQALVATPSNLAWSQVSTGRAAT